MLRILIPLCLVTSLMPAQPGQTIKITWLGHAAFEIISPGGTNLLIDPFLKGNPKTPGASKDLSRYKPAVILVSHSHFDHSADAVEIARSSGAGIISAFDYVSSLDIPDGQKMGGNVGGTFTVGDVTVHLVPAMHSSDPGGRPVGFVIRFADGRSLYHTGDTWIFGDMALIQSIHRPNILLFNTGGGPFTQSPAIAAKAVRDYFKPDAIIPMHFGTFPVLADSATVAAAFKGDKRVVFMEPGETKSF